MEERLEYLLKLRDKLEADGYFLTRTKQSELRRLLLELRSETSNTLEDEKNIKQK